MRSWIAIKVEDYVHWIPIVQQALTGVDLCIEDLKLETKREIVRNRNWRRRFFPWLRKYTVKDITQEMVADYLYLKGMLIWGIPDMEAHKKELQRLLKRFTPLKEGVATSIYISEREFNLLERYRIRYLESVHV